MSSVYRQCELLQLAHICEQRNENGMQLFASHIITKSEKSFKLPYKHLGPKICLSIA